jgi:multicomponent K+:H+ antiporter subunit E
MLKRLFPHPIGSGALAVFWLWLNNTVEPGHILLGALLGWALPLMTRRFWSEQERVSRVWRLLPFAAVVLADIVTANLSVARAVLSPVDRLRPGFVRVPLDLRSDVGISVLANTVSLTPGTLSAELTEDRRELIVHCLDERDPQALVREIKHRYERRLLEVFG